MFKIDNLIYEQLAEELAAQITLNQLLSSKIEFENDDVELTFTATLIPYFKRVQLLEEEVDVLSNLIPVWWEVKTITLDGEVINDFDFKTFKEYICQWSK